VSALVVESERLSLQIALDEERSALERNQLGQFATPPDLAEALVRLGLSQQDSSEPIHFLDPAVGSGAFFSALLRCISQDRIASARGIELDPRFVEAASNLWEKFGLSVKHADFTALAPPEVAGRANLIVANPPYVRHHHVQGGQKNILGKTVESRLGLKVSGLAGMYVYFLLLSFDWMAEGGVAVWLIPSEWLSVNYGRVIKRFLLDRVRLLRIHVFDAADVQFGDALVSSAVILFRNEEPDRTGIVPFTFGGELDRPVLKLDVSHSALNAEEKWSRPAIVKKRAGTPVRPGDGVTVGDLFQIRRGLATGLNEFFIKPRDWFLDLGIPERFLRPILPPSRRLVDPVIERGADGYPAIDEPLSLLDCNLPEEEVQRSFPELWAYLQSESGQWASASYLARGRRPWYSQERRGPALYVCTYMGRGRSGASPFRLFLNRSDAVATNVFLMLYPKPALAERLHSLPGLDFTVWELLTEAAASGFLEHGRVYGGGLHKLEPKELAALPAQAILQAANLNSIQQMLLL
jgi:adenine-specific DNA-methyltransferase